MMNSTVQFDPLVFDADLSNVSLVEERIDEVCAAVDLEDELYGNVLIAVTEAVNNAVLHGAPQSASRAVRFETLVEDGLLAFTISDEGPGFNPSALPDPTAPENLEKEYGRGVFLMRNLADEVVFNSTGNSVTLRFRLLQ